MQFPKLRIHRKVNNHSSQRLGTFLGVSLCVPLLLYCATIARAQQAATLSSKAIMNVVTQRYDNARSGANTNESILNVKSVRGASAAFGKLFSVEVQGNVFAQPLYVSRAAYERQQIAASGAPQRTYCMSRRQKTTFTLWTRIQERRFGLDGSGSRCWLPTFPLTREATSTL
jgi:hypothetical protein